MKLWACLSFAILAIGMFGKPTSAVCGNINSCLLNQHYDASKTNVGCCVFNPYCFTSLVCNQSGWITKNPPNSKVCSSATCSQVECCDRLASCNQNVCTAGYSPLTPLPTTFCKLSFCDPLECCSENPLCTAAFACGGDFYIKSPLPVLPCQGVTCQTEECCNQKPLCTLAVCSQGFHPMQPLPVTSCASSACSVDECCLPNPTCTSSFLCDADHWLKSPLPTFRCSGAVCRDDECCNALPSCTPQVCTLGFTPLPPVVPPKICLAMLCQPSECCSRNPTCDAAFVCSTALAPGFILKNPLPTLVCVGSICSRDECCESLPSCTPSICTTGFSPQVPLPVTPCLTRICQPSECCKQNPSCPSNVASVCTAGQILKNPLPTFICRGPACAPDECCDGLPRCTPSICIAGYTAMNPFPPGTCNTSVCTTTECCTANPKCTATFACTQPGFILKSPLPLLICQGSVCGNEECCDALPVCVPSICTSGFSPLVPLPLTSCSSRVCQPAECCTKNPSCTQQFSCTAGQVLKNPLPTLICRGRACDYDECCEGLPTCTLSVCTLGYTALDPLPLTTCKSLACTAAECCTVNPSCTSTFVCAYGHELKFPLPTRSCLGSVCANDECCEKKSASLSCGPLCPPGLYRGVTAPTTGGPLAGCLSCPPGTYKETCGDAISTCSPCPAGTASDKESADSAYYCLPCAVGTFASAVGSASCLPCPAGTYRASNSTQDILCTLCPAGTYAPIQGAITCDSLSPACTGTVATAGTLAVGGSRVPKDVMSTKGLLCWAGMSSASPVEKETGAPTPTTPAGAQSQHMSLEQLALAWHSDERPLQNHAFTSSLLRKPSSTLITPRLLLYIGVAVLLAIILSILYVTKAISHNTFAKCDINIGGGFQRASERVVSGRIFKKNDSRMGLLICILFTTLACAIGYSFHEFFDQDILERTNMESDDNVTLNLVSALTIQFVLAGTNFDCATDVATPSLLLGSSTFGSSLVPVSCKMLTTPLPSTSPFAATCNQLISTASSFQCVQFDISFQNIENQYIFSQASNVISLTLSSQPSAGKVVLTQGLFYHVDLPGKSWREQVNTATVQEAITNGAAGLGWAGKIDMQFRLMPFELFDSEKINSDYIPDRKYDLRTNPYLAEARPPTATASSSPLVLQVVINMAMFKTMVVQIDTTSMTLLFTSVVSLITVIHFGFSLLSELGQELKEKKMPKFERKVLDNISGASALELPGFPRVMSQENWMSRQNSTNSQPSSNGPAQTRSQSSASVDSDGEGRPYAISNASTIVHSATGREGGRGEMTAREKARIAAQASKTPAILNKTSSTSGTSLPDEPDNNV